MSRISSYSPEKFGQRWRKVSFYIFQKSHFSTYSISGTLIRLYLAYLKSVYLRFFSIFEAIQNYNAIFLFLLGPQDIQKFYAETVPTTSHSIASYDAQPVLEQFVAGKKIQILISRIFPNFMENYKLLNFGYFSITFKRITFKMNFGFICICTYYGGGG